MTDRYSMLNADTTFRKAIAEKLGLEFELPSVQRKMNVEQGTEFPEEVCGTCIDAGGPTLRSEVVTNVPNAPRKMASVV